MRVEDLLVYGKSECHSDLAKMLLAELLELNPLELLNHLNDVVSEEKSNLYKKECQAIREGKPIQYVIGNVNFYGETFYVNENVLIPRFETEELVENTVTYINKFFTEPVDIIDLGCGSGVIGLTLEKKVSTKSVDLIDISPKALAVTYKNCVKLSSTANLINSDMFEKVDKKYDVIISNPPYIKTNEEIEDIVKDNEPHLALYAGEDGLDCYKKILENIESHMKERCLVAFEIGYEQANDIIELVNKHLSNVKTEVKKDLSGKDRMIFIFKNLE
ncbi:MAG: peptide chain release factor N(5)-glutamine methyltransferase [Bacilli bacterium]|nr:peptide chain release factor N(5)-glutamine methyltransferase [Bacilli bacterium]